MSLSNFGIDTGIGSLNEAIDSFQQQNMSPSDIFAAARALPTTIGGLTGIGSSIPGLGRIPLPTKGLSDILAIPGILQQGATGDWQSTLYGEDMNAHHPKFKFLFKVKFEGFGNENFYRYVHRCDKPRVRINHADVNYYNFRTRVQTHITYDPLSVSFLDEIGNSVTEFFQSYMEKQTGTSMGNYGIDQGFGPASSSEPYQNGYSQGKKIIIEQVFGNGTRSNRYTFINPRIEAFDFDELNMEDSNGNMVTINFSYDAFTTETVSQQTLYSWGQTDLLMGGGSSGEANGGGLSGANPSTQISANGMTAGTSNLYEYNPAAVLAKQAAGIDILNMNKNALGKTAMSLISRAAFNQPNVVTSAATTLVSNVSNTLKNVFNGTNMRFGGGEPTYDKSQLPTIRDDLSKQDITQE
jgi:hypothetical protein